MGEISVQYELFPIGPYDDSEIGLISNINDSRLNLTVNIARIMDKCFDTAYDKCSKPSNKAVREFSRLIFIGADAAKNYLDGQNAVRAYSLGENTIKKYLYCVKSLIEKFKPERRNLLASLLNIENTDRIIEAMGNPVFLNYAYEGHLPAFSWSAASGEEMMKALTTGEYKASYEAERRLIKRVNREIYSRQPLGK